MNVVVSFRAKGLSIRPLLVLMVLVLPRIILVERLWLKLLVVHSSWVRLISTAVLVVIQSIVSLNLFWSIFWHAHLLVTPLKLLLVLFAQRRPRRTRPHHATVDYVRVRGAVLRRQAGLDASQILIDRSVVRARRLLLLIVFIAHGIL